MADRKEGWIVRLLEIARDLPYRIKLRLGKRPKVRMLYLEVTHRCNARCITCYTGAGKEKDDVLTLDEKESVVTCPTDGGRGASLIDWAAIEMKGTIYGRKESPTETLQ